MADSRMVLVDGCLTSVTVRGDDSLDVMAVFVAGLGEPGGNWTPTLSCLSRPVRAVSYDRPGVEGSPALPADRRTAQPYSFFATPSAWAVRAYRDAGAGCGGGAFVRLSMAPLYVATFGRRP